MSVRDDIGLFEALALEVFEALDFPPLPSVAPSGWSGVAKSRSKASRNMAMNLRIIELFVVSGFRSLDYSLCWCRSWFIRGLSVNEHITACAVAWTSG